MNDVLDLYTSIKNIEKKRRELIFKSKNNQENNIFKHKKKDNSIISLKKNNSGNIMINNLMTDKNYRSKLLEDVFNKDFRDKKELVLKSKYNFSPSYKAKIQPFPQKSVEKNDLHTNSKYIQLRDKINTNFSCKYKQSLSRNNNSVSVSTANISKHNISLNKSYGEKRHDISNINNNPQIKTRDYTSAILEYKASLHQIKRLSTSIGKSRDLDN